MIVKTLILILTLSLGFVSHSIARPLLPHEVPNEIFLDRSGMPELVANSLVTATIVTPMLTTQLFSDSIRQSSGFIIGPLLGASLPYLLNVDKPMHTGQAGTYNFFQRWGLANGLLISFLGSSNFDGLFAGITSAVTLTSTYAGIELYPRLRWSPAQASALSTGIWVGGASGIIILTLLDNQSISEKTVSSLFLFTMNAGVLGAYTLRDQFNVDRSRILWMDLGGVVGGLIGLGAGWLFKGEDGPDEVLSVTSLAGLFAGLFLAFDLTESIDHYKESYEEESSHLKFESPSVTMIPGQIQKNGRREFAPGINLLKGTW